MAQGFAGPARLLPDALRVATGKVNVLEPSCTDPPSFPCRTGPAGSEQILKRSSHKHNASPPSPPGRGGGVAESPNSRHSTANMPHYLILLDKLM
jgi:hypothetical protein